MAPAAAETDEDRRIAMATTPVNGAATDTTQQASDSSDGFQSQFSKSFESMMVSMTMQFIQTVQEETGTTPSDLWNDD
jgi:hypothetical protein